MATGLRLGSSSVDTAYHVVLVDAENHRMTEAGTDEQESQKAVDKALFDVLGVRRDFDRKTLWAGHCADSVGWWVVVAESEPLRSDHWQETG